MSPHRSHAADACGLNAVLAILCATLILGVVWVAIKFSPLFFYSKIERLGEKNLPRIVIEKGGIVYCRMKADDFRFPLPPGSRGTNPILNSGGFDTVDGTVEARFQGSNEITPGQYWFFLAGKVPVGGNVEAQKVPGGLLIKFHYFGDR